MTQQAELKTELKTDLKTDVDLGSGKSSGGCALAVLFGRGGR